jgi:dTDP-4-amino-4,6-dideoxygalactose transaminase
MSASEEKLAIDGGTPVRTAPMPPRRLFTEAEKAAAVRLFDQAIESGGVFGYNGQEEAAFEQAFTEFMGGGFADGVNSGTNAVWAALGALQLPAGSEVVVPPITDQGGVMPVVVLNCIPVFADSDPRSYNMGPDQFAAVITERTRAVVVAHIAGDPAQVDQICAIARKHDIKVIEDCAQSHGALLNGQKVGTFGDLAAFSTMSGKHFATAAQGGVVYTQDEELHWNGKRFADRGKPLNLDGAGGNVVPGLNCNSNELAAAVGRVQLAKLPAGLERIRAVAHAVEDGLRDCEAVRGGWLPENAVSSYWFMRIRLDVEKLTCDKPAFVAALGAEGIPASVSYRHLPVEMPWTRGRNAGWCPWLFGQDTRDLPVLENAIASTDAHFSIKIHEGMGEPEAADIVTALRKVERAFLS